jgi:hypothetical protein
VQTTAERLLVDQRTQNNCKPSLGLDSYERLSEDRQYRALSREQSNTLACELDASADGIFDDFSHEAYSVDVLLAYAVIARTNRRLGTADAARVVCAHGAFSSSSSSPRGLPPMP